MTFKMIRVMLVRCSIPKALFRPASATQRRSLRVRRALWIVRMEITWLTLLTKLLVTIVMHLTHIRTPTLANYIRRPRKKVTRQIKHVLLALAVKRKGTRDETISRTREKSRRS